MAHQPAESLGFEVKPFGQRVGQGVSARRQLFSRSRQGKPLAFALCGGAKSNQRPFNMAFGVSDGQALPPATREPLHLRPVAHSLRLADEKFFAVIGRDHMNRNGRLLMGKAKVGVGMEDTPIMGRKV